MGRLPDFFLIGVPKAGTSALHVALAQHPDLFLSPVKEPKYYLCGDNPPPKYIGPGDAHSNQEWVWRRDDYLALFAGAGQDQLAGESTPFYLYRTDALRRIHADNPRAKLVAVLRDPVDRAYSNWMHLWMDGLEPVADIVDAADRESRRIDEGYAPFWHYRGQGMYGRQVRDLLEIFPREQLLLLRYRELVDDPAAALAKVHAFLGVRPSPAAEIPRDNSRPFVRDGARTRALGTVIRAGAWLGQFVRPEVWRRASEPLIAGLQHGGDPHRPKLTRDQRAALLAPHLDDIDLLEAVTGDDFSDWKGYREGGTFHSRRNEVSPSS